MSFSGTDLSTIQALPRTSQTSPMAPFSRPLCNIESRWAGLLISSAIVD